jgi:hypothetical protein
MPHLVKALAGSGKAVIDLVAAVLILVGGLLMIGAYVYRVFIHPEWTSDQALSALWPFFAVGSATLMLGWLIDRTDALSVSARERRSSPSARNISR